MSVRTTRPIASRIAATTKKNIPLSPRPPKARWKGWGYVPNTDTSGQQSHSMSLLERCEHTIGSDSYSLRPTCLRASDAPATCPQPTLYLFQSSHLPTELPSSVIFPYSSTFTIQHLSRVRVYPPSYLTFIQRTDSVVMEQYPPLFDGAISMVSTLSSPFTPSESLEANYDMDFLNSVDLNFAEPNHQGGFVGVTAPSISAMGQHIEDGVLNMDPEGSCIRVEAGLQSPKSTESSAFPGVTSRRPRACLRCRQRRILCGRQNPCSTCTRVGVCCVPSTPGMQSRENVEFPNSECSQNSRSNKRKRETMKDLRDRNEQLEKLLKDHQEQNAELDSWDDRAKMQKEIQDDYDEQMSALEKRV